MYPAVADKPEGPFKLARGKDEFYKPFTPSTLLQSLCVLGTKACSQTQRGYDYGGFCSTGNFYSSQGVL